MVVAFTHLYSRGVLWIFLGEGVALIPLPYTRLCSAAFSDPILDQMRKIPTLIQTSFYQIERLQVNDTLF